MSRSGYSDDCDDYWQLIRWRGAVTAAIRGKRGQQFLRDLLAALDAMPAKRLVANVLVVDGAEQRYVNSYQFGPGWEGPIVGADELVDANGDVKGMGEVCALGALGKARGLDMAGLDPEEHEQVAGVFGIADALACEIVYINDEACYRAETPEQRWQRVRQWVAEQIWEWKEVE